MSLDGATAGDADGDGIADLAGQTYHEVDYGNPSGTGAVDLYVVPWPIATGGDPAEIAWATYGVAASQSDASQACWLRGGDGARGGLVAAGSSLDLVEPGVFPGGIATLWYAGSNDPRFAAADFDGDGFLDLVLTGENSVYVMWAAFP